ncbi:PA14 domain-containing protein [Chloropicon primus]|uniref:PA14 domain-containing protein n=2 Tax=Chloropicon primus TaxID=1764295 RepID=A0A5B8MR23_9CHLO|nr:hypothetical protein A3770_09p56860 [Chloropicon primus]UPR02381.1 PA14 domain-containing protein [Chloropicon primus]|eukprot:QDZ23168.1 hypothetical protein A3770_09p56860 [Chloropicon primus]
MSAAVGRRWALLLVLLTLCVLARAQGEGSSPLACEGETIADEIKKIVQDDPRKRSYGLNTLARLLNGTEGGLLGSGSTFYAPTDAAFETAFADEHLRENAGEILRHHFEGSKKRLGSGTKILDRFSVCAGEIVVVDKLLLPREHAAVVAESMELPLSEQEATPRESCEKGHCCDIAPPGRYSCFTQKKYGKCDDDWMVNGGYCRRSCARCSMMSMKYSSIANDAGTAVRDRGILYQLWENQVCSTTWQGLRMITCPNFWWDSLSIFNRIGSKFMKTPPDAQEWITESSEGFEAPLAHRNTRDSGSRMTGFFCAMADGDYVFKLAADDSAALYILDPKQFDSGDFDGFSHYRDYLMSLTPSVKADRSPLREMRFESQWVEADKPTTMRKGEVVFLEAHQKNGGGPGMLKVGVVLPSGEWLRPIPAYMFDSSCGGGR